MSLDEDIHRYTWPNITAAMDCINNMSSISVASAGNGTFPNGCNPGSTMVPSGVGAILTKETYISIVFLLFFGLIGMIGNGTLVCILVL